MITQLHDIEQVIENGAAIFEEATWGGERYSRPIWYGPTEESQMRQVGKREKEMMRRKAVMEAKSIAKSPTIDLVQQIKHQVKVLDIIRYK